MDESEKDVNEDWNEDWERCPTGEDEAGKILKEDALEEADDDSDRHRNMSRMHRIISSESLFGWIQRFFSVRSFLRLTALDC